MFHYFNKHYIIIPKCSLNQFKLINFISYHIIVYVVILVQSLSILSTHFFAFSGKFNKTNVDILLKFTTIADQIHDICYKRYG